MNTKLFKKLNEQIEINNIKRDAFQFVNENREEAEKTVVFEGLNKKIKDSLLKPDNE